MSSSFNCFIPFKESIDRIELPKKFTYPFNYSPHPLCQIAAKELSAFLSQHHDWVHDFGLHSSNSNEGLGKMFGVLVVENTQKEIGYLAAFSGILAGQTTIEPFVPPVYNRKTPTGFYPVLEKEIEQLTYEIQKLQESRAFAQLKDRLEIAKETAEVEIKCAKEAKLEAKKNRDLARLEVKQSKNEEELQQFEWHLKKESTDVDYTLKWLTRMHHQIIDSCQKEVDFFQEQIENLLQIRKQKSAEMQKQLFEKYLLLNGKNQISGVLEIFSGIQIELPPAGAGDCAAPKLLQHAFLHQMKPITMAEFWWGKSPKKEVRNHGQFYPSCRSKCEPILNYMLQGISVDENPEENYHSATDIEIIFEDAYLIVINKPINLLSVPGKKIKDSVLERIKQKYAEIEGPVIVHRLDRSTSGIMVLTKTKNAYTHLQKQFAQREVKKRYVALLSGELSENEGLVSLPLRVDLANRPHQLVCFEHGKHAETRWQKVHVTCGHTRVNFFPLTGRTHQLRVHAAHALGLNASIVGDDLYGKTDKRLFLHAEAIDFIHPVTLESMHFEASCPF